MEQPFEITLVQGWRIAQDPAHTGTEMQWQNAVPDSAEPAVFPCLIQENIADFYTGTAWLWNEFCVDFLPDDQDCFLKVGKTEGIADFWLNGVYLGREIRKEIFYEFDCTDAIRPGKNVLAIRITVPGMEELEGYTFHDMPIIFLYNTETKLPAGGVRYPVSVASRPRTRVERTVVRADMHTGNVEMDISVHNAAGNALSVKILSPFGETVAETVIEAVQEDNQLALQIRNPALWSTDAPNLYSLHLNLLQGDKIVHTHCVRFGFREFKVKDGWFFLNGKRILLRATGSMEGWHTITAPLDMALFRKELMDLKSMNFNALRFHNACGCPEILELCDQLGILVIESHGGSWLLKADNRCLKDMFMGHLLHTVAADINHPSIVVWELVNECHFEHEVAKAALPDLRAIDQTRVVFLGSGRWDDDLQTGSVSNPGSAEWECLWGAEGMPCATETQMKENAQLEASLFMQWDNSPDNLPGRRFQHGDVHLYPRMPFAQITQKNLRMRGVGIKPVFISEIGSNSAGDASRLMRKFQQRGNIPKDERTRALFECGEFFEKEWERFGLGEIYPFPEDMLRAADRENALTRALVTDCMRANPQINGFYHSHLSSPASTLGMLDLFREKRAYICEAVAESNADLHWCLFASSSHIYSGKPFTVDAVLASADVLAPGRYPVCARIHSEKTGCVWEYRTTLVIDDPGDGYMPLAFPVFSETLTLDVPEGVYTFNVFMEQGAAPTGGRKTIYISEETSGAGKKADLVCVDEKTVSWLAERGVTFSDDGVILVGRISDDEAQWDALYERIEQGATAIFLDPTVFVEEPGKRNAFWEQEAVRLRLDNPGKLCRAKNWAFRTQFVMKRHRYSAGLALGVLPDDFYNQAEPNYFFSETQLPDELIGATITAPYVDFNADEIHGYISGFSLGVYNYGKGKLVLNTFNLLDELGNNPAADRLLLNML